MPKNCSLHVALTKVYFPTCLFLLTKLDNVWYSKHDGCFCKRQLLFKSMLIFLCIHPFVKFLVGISYQWIKTTPAFAILDNQWSGMVIYYNNKKNKAINFSQLQEIWRQMNLQGWHLIIKRLKHLLPKQSMIQAIVDFVSDAWALALEGPR